MKERLKLIINYKTRGRQKPFAEMMGWSPAYLTNLLRGVNFGIQPVLTVLRELPEINARWFLLGQGEMLIEDKASDLRQEALNHIEAVLSLEKFVPVMTPDELIKYEEMITAHRSTDFDNAMRLKWIERKSNQESSENIVEQAIKQSDEICRQQKAKES